MMEGLKISPLKTVRTGGGTDDDDDDDDASCCSLCGHGGR